MKTVLFSIVGIALLTFAACNSSTANNGASATQDASAHLKDSATYTTALWSDSLQNFGTVEKGKQVKIVFHVKNTGTDPLFIASASPSCGCTVADYTKSAIASGASGEVTAN